VPEPRLIISTASRKDLSTWLVTYGCLRARFPAAQINLTVPGSDLHLFQSSCSGSLLEIQSDSDVLPAAIIRKIAERAGARQGWYVQQLVKISVAMAKRLNYETLMIWDADSIPGRNFQIVDGTGTILFGYTSEYHPPYFDQISRLLGLEKVIKGSFIAQYMTLKDSWLERLHIDLGGDDEWLERLTETIVFSEPSGFSEYELLGTYVHTNFPDEFRPHASFTVLRRGNSLLGGVNARSSFLTRCARRLFCVVCYESYDNTGQPKTTGYWLLLIELFRQITRGHAAKSARQSS